jgi:hypothetical protein
MQRLRWSRGSVLAFGTQVRGFKPGRSRLIFRAKKILITPSFGGEVKPSVPCRDLRHVKEPKSDVEIVTFGKILGHFSPIVPSSAPGSASVASDAGGFLWRKLERSKIPGSPPSWGFDVPLAKALCKTFLLRILNDGRAGRNPTKGCSADWRRRCDKTSEKDEAQVSMLSVEHKRCLRSRWNEMVLYSSWPELSCQVVSGTPTDILNGSA